MVGLQWVDNFLPGGTVLAEAAVDGSSEMLVRTVLDHVVPAHIPDRMSSEPVVLAIEIGYTKVAVALEMGIDCIHVAVDHTAAGCNSLGS
jgi:hypothetical protein